MFNRYKTKYKTKPHVNNAGKNMMYDTTNDNYLLINIIL